MNRLDMPSASSASPLILLVDRDRSWLRATAAWLEGQGRRVTAVESVDEALSCLRRKRISAAVVRLEMEEGRGLKVASAARELEPPVPVVLTTSAGTADAALHAMRAGAIDLLALPATDADLEQSLGRALARRKTSDEHQGARTKMLFRSPECLLLGDDARMRRIQELASRVVDSRATVLITGESGTGKSLLARWIHRQGRRAAAPFVEVACGALPDTLLESELFGYRPGAFTGAAAAKPGRFQQADGGTIFLDEIATASPAMQVKLLRVLQEMQFEPVGGTETVQVDARVILATHEDLAERVREGLFRHDLYYRINIVVLELPPLRERVGDVRLLADGFLERAAAQAGRHVEGFSEEAYQALERYRWPGNIRELENVVERAAILGQGPVVGCEDLPPHLLSGEESPFPAGAGTKSPLKSALADPERRIILDTLEKSRWNRSDAAKALGINRTTLYKKMKRLGLGLETAGKDL